MIDAFRPKIAVEFRHILVNDQLAMSFILECSENNKYDTMYDEFVWHSKLLTNQLWFVSLLFVVNEMTKM